MSAIVCGKRSNFFEDLQSSSSSSPPVAKRIRCSSYSPPRTTSVFPNSAASFQGSCKLDHLIGLFPDMDKQTEVIAMSLNICLARMDMASDQARLAIFKPRPPSSSHGSS